jgi:hypothetical protein
LTDDRQRQAAPEPPDDQDNRNLRIAVMFGLIVVLVAAGTWLFSTMLDTQKTQACVAELRQNCSELKLPN